MDSFRMKMSGVWQVIGLLSVIAFPSFAQIQDVKITATQKKLDEEKSRGMGAVTLTSKEIVYLISVQNKRFSAIPELHIKYMIFISDAQGGSTEKAVTISHLGSDTLKNLNANTSVSIETKPFVLTSEQLAPGVSYLSGASNRIRDKIEGVWIKAFADGKIVGEFASPPSISKKNDWKEPKE